ncbi:hypothetical protein Q4I32_007307 [Leishmania shawi]|uniref:Nuclear transmembrane protein n=1 Tax=Leishmania shawi TaxID=5680 RepID=A0AAW3B7H8_9TRYP
MEITHLIAVVFFNRVALQYALWASLLLAPLYAFALKPLVRRCRRCAAMKVATAAAEGTALPPAAASTLHNPPVRPSAASSKRLLSSVLAGATPAPFMPIFGTSAAATSSFQARSSIGAPFSPLAPQDLTPNRHGSACSLEATGTAVTLEEAECRSPTQSFMSALRWHVRQRGAALFNGGASALGNALGSGEVYCQRLQKQYDKLNITDASLKALYLRPTFQEWYAVNREELLREVRLRESFAKWRSVATAFVLVVALLLLPAYSFSTQTNAMQWALPLTEAGNEATVATAPLAQLLTTRLYHIQSRESTPLVATRAALSSSLAGAGPWAMATAAVKALEYVSVVAAACALVTSCFMPRESCATASVALVSFLLLVMESALVPGAVVRVGLGFLVVFAIVMMSIYRAAA